MKNKIKLALAICLFILKSTQMDATSIVPIKLERKYTPSTTDIHKPSRAPIHFNIDLQVSMDSDNHSLLFEDCEGNVYSFTITDSNAETVLEGTLDFANTDSIYINLSSLPQGTYSLEIFINNMSFSGLFYIF